MEISVVLAYFTIVTLSLKRTSSKRKGNVPHNKGKKSQGSNYPESKKPQTVKLSSELYDELVIITNNGQLMTVNDAEGRDSNMMILRPGGESPGPLIYMVTVKLQEVQKVKLIDFYTIKILPSYGTIHLRISIPE